MDLEEIFIISQLLEGNQNGTCSSCHREFNISKEFATTKELKEFRLSGLCKSCQDALFNPVRVGE